MEIGDTMRWSRTFTEEDIRLFAQLSGDQGEHHFVPHAQGRLMAHGLLTATLPTKIGGDVYQEQEQHAGAGSIQEQEQDAGAEHRYSCSCLLLLLRS